MRFIKKLFTVPEEEKVTEKHMMRVLISTSCSIILSMACLVSTTWAWYTATVTSQSNVLQIGEWSTVKTVEETTQETTETVEQTTEATEATTEETEATTEAAEVTEETTQSTTDTAEENA